MNKKLYAQIAVTFIISLPFIILCTPSVAIAGAYFLMMDALDKIKGYVEKLNKGIVNIIMYLPRKLSGFMFPDMIDSMREVVRARNRKAAVESTNRRGNAKCVGEKDEAF